MPLALLALAPRRRGRRRAAVLAGVEAVSGFGVMLFDVHLNSVQDRRHPGCRARSRGPGRVHNGQLRHLGRWGCGCSAGCSRTLIGVRPTLAIGGLGGALAVLWMLGTPVISIRSVDDLPDPNTAAVR